MSERRPYVRMLVLAVVVFGVDQATKLWAVSALSGDRPVTVIPHVLRLQLMYNAGAAFSIGAGATWVFTVATAVAVGVILYAGRRVGSPAWTVALGAMLGGAASHLLDRLVREPGFARGHVVDFIDYGGLFVGNIADVALVGGTVLLILLGLRGAPSARVTRTAPPGRR